MYYGEIKKLDIANGAGVRVSLFVSGCTNHCEECFQPQTWNFCYGKPFTEETENEILEALKPAHVQGLTVLGGEPFEPENQRTLLPFLKKVRADYPDKNIWCYSGFVLESELLRPSYARCEVTDEMLAQIDVLVDGRYIKELRNLSLAFRGSSNQRIIDMNKTRATGETTLWEE